MIQRFFMFLLGLAIACGGVVEDDSLPFRDAEILEEDAEIGSLEQAYGAKETATLQFGTQPAGRRCNKTSSGQTCSFLRTKPNVKVCVDYTLGNPFPLDNNGGNWANAAAVAVDNATTRYAFDYSNNDLGFGCYETGPLGNHIVFRRGTISGSSSSSYTGDFARPVFSDLTNLSEQAGVVGSYTSAGNCIITFDTAKCQAKGLNAAEDQKYCTNAAAYAVAGCLGIGGQDVAQGQRLTRTTMNNATFNNVFSAAEDCQQSSLTLTNDGLWQEHSPACNGD